MAKKVEDYEDQVARVRLMAKGDSGTWDLSPNDCAALTSILKRLDHLEKNEQEHERIATQADIRETDDKVCARCGRSKSYPY